uniref:Ribosomal protein L19 n=1 Tax=Tydemania expeditionis TaxID=325645 RepID=A0A0D6E2R1_TYDEX|nr:ribosomal protein L19 [Tydemania expeditionis]CEO91062.1 ribosomal protein L19 [Tydemania expeditionis]
MIKYLKHFDNKNQNRKKFFKVGDYIKVSFLFRENEKKRIQFFEGIVIAIHGSFVTLRKPGIYGVERIFDIQSPQIQTLKVLQPQKFKRAKLFYLRKRIGKAAFGLKSGSLLKII